MTRPQHTTIDSELAYLARALKAPRIGSDYATIAEKARQASWTYEEYLAAVLSVKASARAESGAAGRIKRAGFPQIKTIDEFDFSTQPALDRARIARLETGGWITEAANVIFLGPPGTGKTHLATGLGVIAARQGYRVAFDTATGWITRLTQAHSRRDPLRMRPMTSIAQIGAVVAVSVLLGIGGSAIALSQVNVPEPGEVAVQTVGVPEVVVDDPQDMLSPADEERLRADAQRLDAPSTVRSLHWMVFNESRDNVNDTIEEFMRENYPDQIGDDEYTDGFLAIAAFPDQRQVGSYAGEDVADQLYLRKGQRLEAVNDAIKPGMRDNNIPAALFAGARTALDAGAIEEYAVQSAEDDKFGAALAGGLGAGGVGVAGGSLALVATNRRKKAIDKGRQDHELVTREYAELGARLDEVDIRANSLTSAFADAELRKQWAEVRDRFLNLHEKVSGAGGIGSIDMRSVKAIYDNRAKLADAAEAVRHTSNAEKNINRLFAIENGDAAARRSDLTDIREDVIQARLGVKDPKLEGELYDLEARINDLDRHPTDPDFLDKFVRVLGDYRTLLDVIKRKEFSDVKERKALVHPALYDNNFYYSGYVPYVALSSWHDSNVQAEQAAQSSSATNSSYSSGFSGAGGSSGY